MDIYTEVNHPSLLNMQETMDFLKKSVLDIGATVLLENSHHFGEGFGFSGILVLAESHLSFHGWPEIGFAAIDCFTCGSCNPYDLVEALREYFGVNSYDGHNYYLNKTVFIDRGFC